MKIKLLLLLFALCLTPITTHAAVTKTLEVDFSFSDSSNQQLAGYKLYKEATKVCQTTDPAAAKISCNITTETGTFKFSITAYYADGSESPASPSFPFTISSTPSLPPTAVVSSSTAVGKAPLLVNFNGSSSTTPNTPIVQYNWSFGDGSQATGATTSHSFTTAGTYSTSLTVVDSKGLSNTVKTPIIVTSATSTNPTPPDTTSPPTDTTSPPTDTTSSASDFNIEVGEVSINQTWVKVLFANTFSQPIVVAGPPSSNEQEPVLVRIRNIDQKGFEVRLQEWNYQNGTHAAETFSYIVMDKGTFTLDNGAKVEAGSFTGSNSFQKVNLQQSYNFTPIILSQVITENETDAVTGRISTVDQTSFEYMLQEQGLNITAHTTETVGYIAWEPGKGELDNIMYEVKTTTNSITEAWKGITFQTAFPEVPFFIAKMQTADGYDPAAVRYQNMSPTTTQIKIEEEQSQDSEVGHTTEAVGYLAIVSKTPATVVQAPAPAPAPAPWSVQYVDSEETAREDGRAENAIDGDPTTLWHTSWSASSPSYPHEIQINLGATYAINGIRYLPRQDGEINGTIAKYAVYVSTDGVNWGSAVTQGTFANNTAEKEVLFSAKTGQYLRLVALSEVNAKAWASVAELDVLYK